MSLWVPPTVSRELQDSTEQYRQSVMTVAKVRHTMREFNKELKDIDPYLELVWFDEGVDIVGVVPGRWHVLRHNPGAPPSVIPHVGPDDEYVEPNSALYEKLRQGDLWSARSVRDRERRERLAREAEDRRKEREQDDRLEEMHDRYNAAFRTQVGWDSRWSQNVRGRRGAKVG